MKNNRALAPWIKRFLLEYLPTDRNFSRNTQHSYRDTLRLLLIFTSATLHRKPDELLVADIRPDLVREFLRHIEDKRKCSVSTRNQRLAAVRSLATFIGEGSPEHLSWCAQLRNIPFKKSTHRPVGYLEKDEIEALLAAPDCGSRLGSRDHALLLFLYNTGARADEAAQLTISDLRLHGPQDKSQSFVQLHGKGNKIRLCPLWASTTAALKQLVTGRTEEERVFLGRCGQAMTRFGVHDIVTRYAMIRHYLPFLTMSSDFAKCWRSLDNARRRANRVDHSPDIVFLRFSALQTIEEPKQLVSWLIPPGLAARW